MTLLNRTLAVIAEELRTALRNETADILTIGALLAEAKEHVRHGEWLPWLKKEFSMSDRSAAKYVKAAQFATKFELGSNLNISPSALYLLSEDSYWRERQGRREATEAVISAAKKERIGYDRAKEIIDNKVAEIVETSTAPEQTREPPEPGSEVNARDELLYNFSSAVAEVIRLTKNRAARRFAKTSVPADDLARLGKLFSDLANLKETRGSKPTVTVASCGNATVSPEESAEKMKAKHAALEEQLDLAA
jgi:hypothetical protein